MTEAEVWHPIPGWPKYEITIDGRVRSWVKHHRKRTAPTTPREIRGRLLGRRQYREYTLTNETGEHKVMAHRLVALTFIGPPPEGVKWVVRHLDDDALNNHASNLAYGTQADNGHDMVRNGGSPWANLTACMQGHEYTEESTYWTGIGRRRRCRICQREHNRVYKARLRASKEVAA